MANQTNKIALAVEPLKASAVENAQGYAIKVIANVKRILAENDWDRKKVCPYPSGCDPEYKAKIAKIELFTKLTTAVYASRNYHDPDIRKESETAEARFIANAVADAEAQFIEYTHKLNKKIGDVKTAELVGANLWSHSVIIVTKEDGTIEKWRTQQILNVSKQGKVFAQYPTRKTK